MINEYVLGTQKDYELKDAGDGMKLERFGDYTLARPDPEAVFPKTLSEKEWAKADARFLRKGTHTEWIVSKKMPASWNVEIGTLRMQVKPTSFKHVGLFPEQASNWEWLASTIKKHNNLTLSTVQAGPTHTSAGEGEKPKNSKNKNLESRNVKVLNLFGYTGGATLACAQAGAEVTHIDGSKSTYTWAKKNQELSLLSEVKIKWLIDDSISFLKRELKRGNVYDGIIMDPPSFGHGPNGELWKIEEQLTELFTLAFKVLSLEPLFFLVNGYSSGYSVTTYKNNLLPLVKRYGGTIETGELLIPCTSNPEKKLPAGIVARWRE